MSPLGEPSRSLEPVYFPKRFLGLPHLSEVGAHMFVMHVVARMEDFLHQEHQEGSLALVRAYSQNVVIGLESNGVCIQFWNQAPKR